MRLPLLLALLALPTSALSQEKAKGFDDDFEVDEPSPNLALGPTPRGALISSFGLGWLRSDLVAHVGLGYWLDLTARADSMLLYKGMNAQNGVYGGLRVSPFEGLFRLSLGLEAGEVFVPVEGATKSRTLLRGEVATGLQLERFTVYGRFALQKSRADTVFENRWAGETEAGVGLEGRVGRRLLLGAEVFGWGQPKQATLFQWRLRVGWVN